MRGRKLLRLVIIVAILWVVARILFSGPSEPTIEPGSTLVVELSGGYVEEPETSFLERALGDRRRPFVGLLSRLAMAERDDRIDTVLLRMSTIGMGWSQAYEVREAIGDLKEKGKRVVAHLEVFGIGTAREYYIATAADEIHLAPGSGIAFVGLTAEYLYLGGMWEEVGIEIDVTKVGKYKSAPESIAGESMSDAAREMANWLLDDVFAQFVAAVAEGRGLSEADVHAAIERGPVLPEELEALGLIDGVIDFHDLEDQQTGDAVEPETYARVSAESVGFEPVAQVALVYGSGNVVSGSRKNQPGAANAFASRDVSDALVKAAKDEEIDAILFRVDSPGGSAAASEEVWQAVRRVRRDHDKPIVASLGDVAASGGYYVVSGADAIVASPLSITGSIGVYVLRPILEGMFDKLGINTEQLQRGPHADLGFGTRAPSKGSRERMQRLTADAYVLFTQRVAEGREMEPAAVERAAQGAVWTGAQAKELGLVDGTGGIEAAVAELRILLELDPEADVALVPYPAPKSLAEQLTDLMNARSALSHWLPEASAFEPLRSMALQAATLAAQFPPNTPLLVPPIFVDIR